MKISVYMPNRGQIETETVESLFKLSGERIRPVEITITFLTGDSLISRARNECAAHFLGSDAAKLFFIDSDIVFDTNDFMAIAMSDKDLIGADYHVSRRAVHTNESRGTVALSAGAPEIAPVNRLPTGFMCVRRAVFERLVPRVQTYVNRGGQTVHDFFSPFVFENEYLSEDFAFCVRALAARAAVPHLHSGVRLGHLGRQEWRLPPRDQR